MSDTPERRNAKRIEIRLPIVYRGPDGIAVPGTMQNVSRTGMLLVVRRSAAPGTSVRVAITGTDGGEREVTGAVVRVTDDGAMGIAVAERDAAALGEVIDRYDP